MQFLTFVNPTTVVVVVVVVVVAIDHSWSTRLVTIPHYNIFIVERRCWFDDFPFFSKTFCSVLLELFIRACKKC